MFSVIFHNSSDLKFILLVFNFESTGRKPLDGKLALRVGKSVVTCLKETLPIEKSPMKCNVIILKLRYNFNI